jgi:two-component system, LytTR family, response regulator
MKDYFFVPGNRQYIQILFSEIQYIEAVKKYVRIFTAGTNNLVPVSLCYAETHLPREMFCRIHKSYIISLLHTKKFDCELAYIADKILPVGNHYRDILFQKAKVWGRETKDHTSSSENLIDKLISEL